SSKRPAPRQGLNRVHGKTPPPACLSSLRKFSPRRTSKIDARSVLANAFELVDSGALPACRGPAKGRFTAPDRGKQSSGNNAAGALSSFADCGVKAGEGDEPIPSRRSPPDRSRAGSE